MNTDEPVVDLDDGVTIDDLADAITKRQAATTPQRSNLGDVPEDGIVRKAGESGAFYGGYDKYSEIGETDAEIASNLYIAKVILTDPRTGESRKHDWTHKPVISDRMLHVMTTAATKALGRDPDPIPEYTTDSAGYVKERDADRFASKGYRAMRAEAKAMTSTGTNVGDEWVPTFAAAELWRDVHLATEVSAQILNERWEGACYRPERRHNEYGYWPTLTAEWEALNDAVSYLAARMIGDEVHDGVRADAHDAITDELTAHIHRRLVDWAFETLNGVVVGNSAA